MRLSAMGACTLLLAATWTAPASQAGAAVPTISGPATVRYYAQVQLTGTTPQPNQQLVIYGKWPWQTDFDALRMLSSDASGQFSVSYVAVAARSYYVRAGGVNSAVHTTALPAVDCMASRPAFRKLPFSGGNANPHPELGEYAALTNTRDGLWAGYAVGGLPVRWAVITWRRGEPAPTVLQRFRERHHVWLLGAEIGDVDIAGITPRGAVVAAVRSGDGFLQRTGYVWFHGRRHLLAGRRTWTSVYPEAVTDRGHIVGWVRSVANGVPSFYVVEWPRWNESPTVLFRIARRFRTELVVDSLGDIAFPHRTGSTVLLRGDAGSRRLLDTYRYSPGMQGAGGPYLYGGGDGHPGLLRWDLTTLPPAGPVIATTRVGELGPVTAANSRGDFVSNHRISRVRQSLVTAGGAHVLTPKQVHFDGWAGQALDEHGVLAYTASSDGLPHLLRCRPA